MKETPLQIQIATLLDIDFAPEDLIWYAVPNGANLPKKQNKKGEWWSPEAHKLKMMGMKAGVTDLVCHFPERTMTRPDGGWLRTGKLDTGHIEIKTPEPHSKLSSDQEAFRDRILAMGGKHAVCRCYEDVRRVLTGWGVKCLYRVQL